MGSSEDVELVQIYLRELRLAGYAAHVAEGPKDVGWVRSNGLPYRVGSDTLNITHDGNGVFTLWVEECTIKDGSTFVISPADMHTRDLDTVCTVIKLWLEGSITLTALKDGIDTSTEGEKGCADPV